MTNPKEVYKKGTMTEGKKNFSFLTYQGSTCKY